MYNVHSASFDVNKKSKRNILSGVMSQFYAKQYFEIIKFFRVAAADDAADADAPAPAPQEGMDTD